MFLAVFILLIPIAIAPAGETVVPYDPGSYAKVNGTDGSSCTNANTCNGGFCVHSLCRSASTHCGDGFCDSGETSSSCSSDCTTGGGSSGAGSSGGATTTEEKKAEEKPAPTPVTNVSVPVTEPTIVQQIVSVINPADLGVNQINIENVQVTKIGVAEVTTTTQSAILESTIQNVLPTVTDATAQQALNEIKQALSIGASSPVAVTTMLEVFEVKEKTTNKTAFSTKISLSFKADKKLQDVNIVEVIPKTVAASISQVLFSGEQPKVLQSDPIVQWVFPVVEEGQTKSLSYQVAKKLVTVDTKTIAVGEVVAPTPLPKVTLPEKPSFTYLYIIGGLVVVLVIAYIVYRQMKMKK